MAKLKPCFRFSTPSGCPFGANCHFSHERVQKKAPLSKLAAANQAANQASYRPPPSANPNQPRQRCHAYWTFGQCQHGKDCRFEHIEDPDRAVHAEDRLEIERMANEARPTKPFPDLSCLDDLPSDPVLVPFRYYSARKVENMLKTIQLIKSLKTVDQAEELLLAILSSNNQNAQWIPADRQRLLASLGTEINLPLLLRDIIRWPKVTSAGSESDRMSFQNCWMGLIAFLTSETVLGTAATMHKNAMYAIVEGNLDAVIACLERNIEACVQAGTFRDLRNTSMQRHKLVGLTSGVQVFAPVITLFLTLLDTYRSAFTSYPEIVNFAHNLDDFFDEWSKNIDDTDHLALLSAQEREYMLSKVKSRLTAFVEAADRSLEVREVEEPSGPANGRVVPTNDGLLAAIERRALTIETGQPRHDNDFVHIHQIQIAPTTQELMSVEPPYRPPTLPLARHHLPEDSMEKVLDVQFRLLRIDAFQSLKIGLASIFDDLVLPPQDFKGSQLKRLINAGGGRYSHRDGSDQVSMPLFTGVEFEDISTNHRNGLVIEVQTDAPPGQARSHNLGERKRFWQDGKRLQMGGLVALVTKPRNKPATVSLAVLTTPPDKIEDIRGGRVQFGLALIDEDDTWHAANLISRQGDDDGTIRLLIESPVMYESVRPFLQALQRANPVLLPFRDHIKHTAKPRTVGLPLYATRPDFRWNLKPLLKDNADIDELLMYPDQPDSIKAARDALYVDGKLDPSQTNAVLDCLTREMALVQGPPGTGKTFTGVELIRLLLANNVGHVLLLALTNHALDHILRAIYDSDVTKRLARLGTRSKDEVIAGFSPDNISRDQANPFYKRDIGRAYRAVFEAQDVLDEHLATLAVGAATEEKVLLYLRDHHPNLLLSLQKPPEWAKHLFDLRGESEGWNVVGKGDRGNTLWSFWRAGYDLTHLDNLRAPTVRPSNPLNDIQTAANRFGSLSVQDADAISDDDNDKPAQDPVIPLGDDRPRDETWDLLFQQGRRDYAPPSEDSSDDDTEAETAGAGSMPPAPPQADEPNVHHLPDFLAMFSLAALPPTPESDRTPFVLFGLNDVWSFSMKERRKLAQRFERQAKETYDEKWTEDLERLSKAFNMARRAYEDVKANARIQLLRGVELLGATTTGAVKLPDVLKGFNPKVLVVEEAGQVLEAHVLATLCPSIEHVIAIGDPLQLRPNLNCFDLSVEHAVGKDLYRFDVSLTERLASDRFPMSQLQIQRRMRPAISRIISRTLYPNLENHDRVKRYPDVQGMSKNVFFFHHMNREGGQDDDTKYNDFEVQMGCELAVHLLKQGIYNKEGDIVILCAYAGQLVRFKHALAGKVAVIVDEREDEILDKHGDEVVKSSVDARLVNVDQQISLRTIDNFQGEEAKIVILSLVRNRGDPEDKQGGPKSIGFLKTHNRVNVALSRAQHGMYILGNKDQLAERDDMWRRIIDDLSEEGGCQLPCGGSIEKCGHLCTYACHPDDREHRRLLCRQKCTKLHEPCGHPCAKLRFEDCGPCKVVKKNVELPCGHTANVPCREFLSLSTFKCQKMVEKPLPTCEHSVHISCSTPVNGIPCRKPCSIARDCCGRSCTANCSDCQNLSITEEEDLEPGPIPGSYRGLNSLPSPAVKTIVRSQHVPHKCDKVLDVCGHTCPGTCARDHTHARCNAPCPQRCEHKKCDKRCRDHCAPCQTSCSWQCEHQKCQMPCCMPCDRLPCDAPCPKKLRCGHGCPTVCGEVCNDQICPLCGPAAHKEAVIDFYENKTLVEMFADDPTTRIVTLACRHVFTIESLDGHVGMSDWYEQDVTGKWVGLKEPKIGFVKRPVCPTCRGPINIRRYNRVTKRALLDIQEQHSIEDFSLSIASLRKEVSNLDSGQLVHDVHQATMRLNIGKIQTDPDIDRITGAFIFNPQDTQCTDPAMFIVDAEQCFGLSSNAASAWRRINWGPFELYTKLVKLVNTDRLPHVQAYESAIATVYHHEMELATKSNSGRDPAPSALLSARRRVGAAFPRGEARFKIEALIESIKLRLKLAPTAKAFADQLRPRVPPSTFPNLPKNRRRDIINRDVTAHNFNRMTWAMLNTCERDIKLALALCDKAEARRLELSVVVLSLQVLFDNNRFATQGIISSEARPDGEFRARVANMSMSQREEAARSCFETYYKVEKAIRGNAQTLAWAKDTIVPTMNQILQEWSDFATITLTGSNTFYAPVSLEEKMAIVQAVVDASFGTGGRFYQCPNGHSFTIDQCGQAMEERTCIECGAPIGGASHQLRGDNTRDLELEQLARNAGADANPFANVR